MRTLRNYMNYILNALAGASFIAMVILTCWQVFTRYILKHPSSWSEELVSYLFAWMALLGASVVVGERGHMNISIAVERTPDILGTIGPKKKGQFLCGFSMETRDMLANSSAKLEKKNLDMVVANNLKVAGAGFGVDTNVVTFITPDGARELPLMSKDDVADAILDEILARKSK